MDNNLLLTLNNLAKSKQALIGTVESCTGGLISSMITQIPGVSSWFWGGWITYDNKAKMNLGISQTLLENHGAVSKECCQSMLLEAKKQSSCTHLISTTGIAGPSSYPTTKPIGTVFIGILSPNSIQVFPYVFKGSRQSIQKQTAIKAFEHLIQELRNE
jgi:PncC family amidohydrolase